MNTISECNVYKRRFMLILCLLLTLGQSFASGAPPSDNHSAPASTSSADNAFEVKIDNFAFVPAQVTVKAGTRVIWINRDDIPHTIDSADGKFRSGALDTDDHFQFRFSEPGEYPFFCRMHPKMTGTIIVKP